METCAVCGHSKAYHDLQDGRPCRAWDPDQPAPHKCVCPGWKDKPKGAAGAGREDGSRRGT